MAKQGWPEPPPTSLDNRAGRPYNNLEPLPPEPAAQENHLQQVGRWGSEQVKDQAKGYAIGKAAQYAARTGLGLRVLFFARWLWIAEWGSLGAAVLLTILSIITFAQKDGLLGIFGLVLAALAFGLWFLVRKLRRFFERQIDRAFQKFQALLQQGQVRMNDWPNWYSRHKAQF